ncbi:polysaccharide pyruvyl transferase family protein [Pelagibacterium lentulum]|uniref:Polysaccharide pyruvyl transferase domain-containing protein n=1 Tax=Pelagibacterium lentulum TaxID=2029865 RepID=A0A916R824_9HYPH|nr:polysaccharide pyruvyl transferase family protein [Pelagibacterium lentulum]GGA40974.1 hypothetical protein GCM10011499_08190 [Pelagibacterium lentulum]
MEYVLVSTYPKEGTQNIGDKLIEQSTANAIRTFDPEAKITTVWRAESWEAVRNSIAESDHVVFACLAIRKNMSAVYPYLEEILDLGIPVSVIAAGTSLPVGSPDMLNKGFASTDVDLLQRLSEASCVFTTRGVLSQTFCDQHQLSRAELSGDVAFFDPRFDERRFEKPAQIKRIVISDPHYGDVYAPVLVALVEQLQHLFPDAEIECALHGVNPLIEAKCDEIGLPVRPIYREPETGLDIYDAYDMHAGFRVHGHVSALKRRYPSYLLEQDGRGTDYALTFSRRISVPCHRTAKPTAGPTAPVQPPAGNDTSHPTPTQPAAPEKKTPRFVAPRAAAELLGALIAQDALDGFRRFHGFETDISDFNARTRMAVKRICDANNQQ